MRSFFHSADSAIDRQRVWNTDNIIGCAESMALKFRKGEFAKDLLAPTLRTSPHDDLECFLTQLLILETASAEAAAQRAFSAAGEILHDNDVRWGVSRLDFLWAELVSRLADAANRLGKSWLGGYLASLRHRELRLSPLADETSARAKPQPASPAAAGKSDFYFSGDWLRDRARLESELSAGLDGEAWLQFEICEYLLSQDPSILLAKAGDRSPRALAEIRLVALFSGDNLLLKRLPNFSTLARRESGGKTLRYLDAIEKILSLRAPGLADWVELGNHLDKFFSIESSPRWQVLVLAWLYRATLSRRNTAQNNYFLQSYLERAASDPYRLLAREVTDNLPRNVLSRSASIANLTTSVVSVLGKDRLHGLFRAKRLHLDSRERAKAVELVAQELGRLKGPLMKVGQMASYLTDDLRDDERKLFEFLWSSAPALPFASLRQTMDPRVLGEFAQIEPVPVGTGSVSQVHRGVLTGGEEVAVKILLPGIEELISSDLLLLRSVLPLAKFLAPAVPLSDIYQEIDQNLGLETDLLAEARVIVTLRDRFREFPDIHLPAVLENLGRKNTLTMSFERGQTFNEYVKSASQEERDRAGAAIVRFVVTSVRDGFFSTDPHPGNYLFNGPRVTFLDFGSFADWDAKTSRAWNDLILAFLRYDFELFLHALDSLHCIERRAKGAELRAVFEIFAKPQKGFWNTGEFCALDAKVTAGQLKGMVSSFTSRSPIKLYPKYLFGLRIYLGHLNVVARLGSRHNWTELVGSIFDA